ncbi:hypothetical protein [Sphingopyxis sp. JAI128]|uniref:hypothetical protein n=1 Tax=Sphingopyxis sp. JAI128 TaxID=2723066 RepID=UPI00160710BA|nr:hypothetical protein [Sphingopyxis sp. JAI128]MBB6424399.1 hypothetical protein [Sphingopyxis sp. JAI128]
MDLSIEGNYSHEAIAIAIFIAVFGIYTLYTPELFESAKSLVLESTNRGHYIFYNICAIGLVYSLMVGWKKHMMLVLLSLSGLALVMYIGHRSALAIAIAGCVYLQFRNKSLLKLKPLHIIGALGMILFLAVYKSIYLAVKMGDFSAVKTRLTENPLMDNAVIGLEQFLTFAHLDFVVTYDYSLPCSNLWNIPISLIPFMDEFVDVSTCGYNTQVQQVFFSAYRGGVAANIWAEFYAIFGYAGIPLVVLAIVGLCKALEYFMNRIRSPLLKTGLILSIINLTVYIQRKELIGGIVSAKRVILVVLLVYGLAYAVRMLTPRKLRPA